MAEGSPEKAESERGSLAEPTSQAEGVRVFTSGLRAPPLFCLSAGGAHGEKEAAAFLCCIPSVLEFILHHHHGDNSNTF